MSVRRQLGGKLFVRGLPRERLRLLFQADPASARKKCRRRCREVGDGEEIIVAIVIGAPEPGQGGRGIARGEIETSDIGVAEDKGGKASRDGVGERMRLL